jgi:feruloyl-CoA synthase
MVSNGGIRLLFAPPRTIAAASGEPGVLLLRSAEELGEYPVTVVHSLRAWATIAPNYPLVAERDRGGWRTVSYGRTVAAADSIGQALLERGLGPGRPLLVLSGNGVDHLLVTLGAMTAGIPVAPVSVAYSLQSRDHARIREIAELIRPARCSPRTRAFDADGFYRTGDAVAFADPADPSAGLVFRGRIAEDFKLTTGTFVRWEPYAPDSCPRCRC